MTKNGLLVVDNNELRDPGVAPAVAALENQRVDSEGHEDEEEDINGDDWLGEQDNEAYMTHEDEESFVDDLFFEHHYDDDDNPTLDVSTIPVGENNITNLFGFYGMGDMSDEHGGEAEDDDVFLPTTVAGPIPESVVAKDDAHDSLRGCVILNNCGSLLARTGSKITGTKKNNNMLQRIVSVTEGYCVPLLYPEAMLFPSIFWHGTNGGEILGAIPSGLLADNKYLAQVGIASISDHVRMRLMNSNLSTSTDPRYVSWMFDSVLNLSLRDHDTRVIMNRAFAAEQGDGGVRIVGADSPIFDTDMLDSRAVVNQLSAAIKEEQATYFFTTTANQLEHFGLRRIKQWIDGTKVIDILSSIRGYGDSNASDLVRRELKESITQSAAIVLLRNWYETTKLYMAYITYSNEKPLGKVTKIWWRYEYQDARGNLPHIHALIWIDGTVETEECTMGRIRGSIGDLVKPGEIHDLVLEGLLNSALDVVEVRESARRILKHQCDHRCKRRTGPANDQSICRQGSAIYENPSCSSYSAKEIRIGHSAEASKILCGVGMMHLDNYGMLCLDDECLRGIKHYAPFSAGEGCISQCNGRLFVATLSSQNLQRCTGYLAARYLAKYVASIDESNRVHVGATHRGLSLDHQHVDNTKITGSAINEQKRAALRRDSHNPKGRAVGLMEMMSLLLGYQQVYTTLTFVHVSTLPMEERPGMERRAPVEELKRMGVINTAVTVTAPQDLDCSRVIPSHICRMRIRFLPSWRQFLSSELLLIRDQMLSPLTMDSCSVFGTRPPELRFIQHQCVYFKYFSRSAPLTKTCSVHDLSDTFTKEIVADFTRSSWIDSTNCRIRVRLSAIPQVFRYITEELTDADFGCNNIEGRTPRIVPTFLFQKMCLLSTNHNRSDEQSFEWLQLKQRFIEEREKIPVIWCNNLKPDNPNKFLYHLVMSMGKFNNEVELFTGGITTGSLRSVFFSCGLLDANLPNEENLHLLLRRYIKEQLMYAPGGSQQFDRCCVKAHAVLRKLIYEDTVPIDAFPPVLYTALHLRAQI